MIQQYQTEVIHSQVITHYVKMQMETCEYMAMQCMKRVLVHIAITTGVTTARTSLAQAIRSSVAGVSRPARALPACSASAAPTATTATPTGSVRWFAFPLALKFS